MRTGYTTHHVSLQYLYNDSLRKLIPFLRPIRKVLLFQRQAPVKPQWNIDPQKTWMQHNEHTCTHDTWSNSQWKKYKNGTMQIYPITTRGNDTWYWILNNHEPHARCMHCTHTVYSWPHMRGEFRFKFFFIQFLFMGSGVYVISFNFNLHVHCTCIIIWQWWNMAHV